jgi:PAS domain S-box-containing protein
MFDLILANSLLAIVEKNVIAFAIGHVASVVFLLVLYFKSTQVSAAADPQESSAFESEAETESAFAHTEAAAKEEAPYEAPSSQPFTAQEPETAAQTDSPAPAAEETSEPEDSTPLPLTIGAPEPAAPEAAQAPEEMVPVEKQRQLKALTLINEKPHLPLIAISREETILELNATASALLGYRSEELAGRRIDEIIFLEESTEGNDAQQRARAQTKNGEPFPLSVELEMADREFGIITITLFPERSLATPAAQAITDPEEAPSAVIPEPVAAPVVEAEATPARPLPPPPPPRKKAPSEALDAPAQPSLPVVSAEIEKLTEESVQLPIDVASISAMDAKAIEMISNNISSPLQSILQLAALIASDENAIPHLKKYAVAIQSKSNRILSQIEEMALIVSSQKAELQQNDRPFNLSRMISSMIELASNVMGEQQQRIHFTRDELDLIVLGDESIFEKLISHLINLSLQSAEQQDISVIIESSTVQAAGVTGTPITFDGQSLQIDGTRSIRVKTLFPCDRNGKRFFETSINRPEGPTQTRMTAALKSSLNTIRTIKELSTGMGGKFTFRPDQTDSGVMEFSVDLPSTQVASYPA